MPWHVAKSGSCPASKPWAVIKNQDGRIEGCHGTQADADAQMAALYASEENAMTAERFYLVAPIERVDVREASATHDNTWTMSGYAAVFDQQTTAYDDGFDRLTIEIDPHAFDRLLATQRLDTPEGAVHFNLGHDMNTAVAATDVPEGQPGSLRLSADSHGLHFLARVSRDDPDGVRLASKMRSGVVRQASFAFTVANGGQKFTEIENEDGSFESNRRITEMQQLFDVCACPQGVFSQTVSGLQSYAKFLGQPERSGGRHRQPDTGGEIPVSPETEGEEATPSADREAQIRQSLEVLSGSHYGGMFRKE